MARIPILNTDDLLPDKFFPETVRGPLADLGRQDGVDDTGATECATAINSALSGFASLGVRGYAKGTFKVASTVIIKSAVDFSDATFNWTGADNTTAVQVGSGISGNAGILQKQTVRLPKVINTMKSGTGWTGSSVGVQIINAYGCEIHVPHVRGFVTGLYTYGKGTGSVYNHIVIGHLENNKRNLACGADATGWSNSNEFRLGSLSHNSSEGSSVTGTRQILIETSTGNPVNANDFIGGSVEGNTAEYHLDCDGPYNVFDNVRWENGAGGGCRVIWRAGASNNSILNGYGAEALVETHVSGSRWNDIVAPKKQRHTGSTSGDTPFRILENTSSAGAAIEVILDPAATVNGADPATAYRVLRSANETRMKRAADAAARMRFDHTNGRLYIGDGVAAPTVYLGYLGDATDRGLSVTGGHLFFGTNNTHDLGFTGLKPRYVRAATGVQTGAFNTATRPLAATAGIGAMIYDTTLDKPLWSDGTAWRDATGAVV